MENFSFLLEGVRQINILSGAIENYIEQGMDADNALEDAGFHLGTNVRRKNRALIRDSANMVIRAWELFMDAHQRKACEHTDCPLNTKDYSEVQEIVLPMVEKFRAVVDHADLMEMECGDEIVPDPERPQESPFEMMMRGIINGDISLN